MVMSRETCELDFFSKSGRIFSSLPCAVVLIVVMIDVLVKTFDLLCNVTSTFFVFYVRKMSPPSENRCFRGTDAKVFKLDVDKYTEFYYKEFLYAFLWCPVLSPLLCLVLPCEHSNIRDRAEAISVGVTKTHLIYCKEQVRNCWRMYCCDEGKVVREIPLTKITDVIVTEPAGGCLPENMLYKVAIETPGAKGTDGRPEIVINGLHKDDAYQLRSLVMKTTRPKRNDTMRRA